MTVGPIRGIERLQIDLRHGIDHEPRQMIRRQPIPDIRRQQKPLLPTTLNEVLRHTGIVLTAPDGAALCDNLHGKGKRRRHASQHRRDRRSPLSLAASRLYAFGVSAGALDLDDVFGVTRDVPLNYVARAAVDALFLASLRRHKHLIVFGSSKQGKTTLRKRCLNDDAYVVVTCSNKWSHLEELHTAILKAAGYVVEQSTTRTAAGTYKVTAKVEGKAGVPFLAQAKAGGEGGYERHTERASTVAPLELDAADVNDIIAALAQIGFEKLIVLEDFHYLPEDTQRDFAVALKAFHESSKLSFIVVGVWLDENRLIEFNGDLIERVIGINVDTWAEEELEQVIDEGARLLNVEFYPYFKQTVIEESFGSVSIVQVACHDVCEAMGVRGTQEEPVVVGRGVNARNLVRSVISKQSSRYRGFLQRFAGGFHETELDLYRWILLPILMANPRELRKGLSFEHVQRTISGYHPHGEVGAGRLIQALESVASLQVRLGVKPIVLDYDQSTRRLNVVDRGFLIWLETEGTRQLLISMELPEYPQLPS